MTCDIFIRTWKPDLGWLRYALAFLAKNWADTSRIFVIANDDCREECQTWPGPAEFIYVEPWPDTHEFKCYCALLSEGIGDADLVLNIDSDTMLLKRSTLSDFLHEGRPIIYYQPHAQMGDYLGIRLYNPVLLHWFGQLPTCSYMLLPPFVFWRSTVRGVRELIERRSRKSLRDTLYSEHPFHWHHFPEHPMKFPDWEMLGFYADRYQNDQYYFRDPHRDGADHRVKPYHSWSQWTVETQAELDQLLAT